MESVVRDGRRADNTMQKRNAVDNVWFIRVLAFIYDNPGCTQFRIRDDLIPNNGTLRKVLDELIVDGYIQGIAWSTPTSKRMTDHHYLTEKGVRAASLCKCLLDLDADVRRNVDLEIDHMMRGYLEDSYDLRLKEAANMPDGRVHTPTIGPEVDG